jgi:hypothetical protein
MMNSKNVNEGAAGLAASAEKPLRRSRCLVASEAVQAASKALLAIES